MHHVRDVEPVNAARDEGVFKGNLILVGRNQKKLDEQAEGVRKQYGVEVYTIAAVFLHRKQHR